MAPITKTTENPAKKIRNVKLPLPTGDLGNRHGYQAPVHKTKEMGQVRAVVATWHGRTLRVQSTADLQRALVALEAFDGRLVDLSPHAPRLLANLRLELAKPERQL